MPKSLDKGTSAVVPVKVPHRMRNRLRLLLGEGETISSLTRELWSEEIERRQQLQQQRRRKKKHKHN